MYLGIEIGGTKLQLGVGAADGKLAALWRGRVDPARGAEGIREQILAALPEMREAGTLHGVGVGFGGPVDDTTATVIRSHQIEGWDGFPLADWISDVTGLPAALGNDAAVAGLAEAWHGAGKGLSPIFYMTIGSGIGGCLVIDGEMYRGCGRGAGEVGHLRVQQRHGSDYQVELEEIASGWGIERRAETILRTDYTTQPTTLRDGPLTVQRIGECASAGDSAARFILNYAIGDLAGALRHVVVLLCPRVIVIGGGVALLGEDLFFAPLRRALSHRMFGPFVPFGNVVPAALGEEVVVHGAIELARKRYGGMP